MSFYPASRFMHPARRAFTMVELLIVSVLGALAAAMALGLLVEMGRAASRADFQLRLTEEIETAMDRLEVELDAMLPRAIGGYDFRLERLEGESIRFWSTSKMWPGDTDAYSLGVPTLVEVGIEPGNTPGSRVLTRRVLTDTGEPTVQAERLRHFDRSAGIGLTFTPLGEPAGPGQRPSSLRVELLITDAAGLSKPLRAVRIIQIAEVAP